MCKSIISLIQHNLNIAVKSDRLIRAQPPLTKASSISMKANFKRKNIIKEAITPSQKMRLLHHKRGTTKAAHSKDNPKHICT